MCSTARCVGGEWQKVGPLPEAWLRRLHTYLERVDWDDPTLWTYSLAEEAFVYLDGRPKERSKGNNSTNCSLLADRCSKLISHVNVSLQVAGEGRGCWRWWRSGLGERSNEDSQF